MVLAELGIRDVRWDTNGTVIHAHDETAGYILTRAADKYQRPIAFAFAGRPPAPDGSSFHLDRAHLHHSVNFKLAAAGLVYPTYYKGLFPDLGAELTATVVKARHAGKGLWPHEQTAAGATVPDLTSLMENEMVLPKLFRRLAEYMIGGGSLDGFVEFLEARAEEIFILSQQHFTHLDTVVRVKGDTVAMTVPPEDIIFIDA